jgi:hypothetical protein
MCGDFAIYNNEAKNITHLSTPQGYWFAAGLMDHPPHARQW